MMAIALGDGRGVQATHAAGAQAHGQGDRLPRLARFAAGHDLVLSGDRIGAVNGRGPQGLPGKPAARPTPVGSAFGHR
jgi:hypothetical protein